MCLIFLIKNEIAEITLTSNESWPIVLIFFDSFEIKKLNLTKGLGQFAFAPFATFLLHSFGWKITIYSFAGVSLLGVLCGTLLRPLISTEENVEAPHDSGRRNEKDNSMNAFVKEMVKCELMLKPTFLLLGMTQWTKIPILLWKCYPQWKMKECNSCSKLKVTVHLFAGLLLFIAWKWPLKLVIFQNSWRNKKWLHIECKIIISF